MEQYKEPTNIKFIPHCSNCGVELSLEEMSYEELSFSKPIKKIGKFREIPYSSIKPIVCPNCESFFESIIIDFGWYHGDVDIQYHEMIKFIQYLDKNYSDYLGEKENEKFNKFRKLYYNQKNMTPPPPQAPPLRVLNEKFFDKE